MRDDDGSKSREIDTFVIAYPFLSGIQEKEYTGNRGIANITLSIDFKCIEPDACISPAVSTKSTGEN